MIPIVEPVSTTCTAATEAIEAVRIARAAVVDAEIADREADKACRRCGRDGWRVWSGSVYGPCHRCGGAGYDPTRTIPATVALQAAASKLPVVSVVVAEFARSTDASARLLYAGVDVVAAELAELAHGEAVPAELAELTDAHPLAVAVVRAIVEGRQTRALRADTVEALQAERKAARR